MMGNSRICLKDCKIGGLQFLRGVEYQYTYNSIDGNIYIYDVFGRYTDISKKVLDIYFL